MSQYKMALFTEFVPAQHKEPAKPIDEMTPLDVIGLSIDEGRYKGNLSGLAKAIGFKSRQGVSNIINGKNNLGFQKLIPLMEATGTNFVLEYLAYHMNQFLVSFQEWNMVRRIRKHGLEIEVENLIAKAEMKSMRDSA